MNKKAMKKIRAIIAAKITEGEVYGSGKENGIAFNEEKNAIRALKRAHRKKNGT